MRISDWSSDVCSSDLLGPGPKSRACLSCRLAIDGDAADVFVRRLRLGQGDSQHAVLEAGVRVVAVDPFRQADAPLEASIAAFGIAAVLVRDLGLLLAAQRQNRSEEHTSELQSLMRISYAVFCLKKKKTKNYDH